MKHLIIKNIGSISALDIELGKLNVFIGPQGSGKSTIIKVISFCSWIEKKLSLNETYKERFEQESAFANELVRFHKLDGYLSEDSYIEYETDVIKITYFHAVKVPIFEWKDHALFKKPKISYTPSERNIVAAIPNFMELKIQDNYIRNLIVDWVEARQMYSNNTPLTLPFLDGQFYMDEAGDKIVIGGRAFDFTNTSSGVQSSVPLYVLVDYFTNWQYNNKISENIKELESNKKLELKLLMKYGEKLFSDGNLDKLNENFNKIITIQQNYTAIQYTSLFIEEPEQNLFPKTQRDLVYQLVKTINSNPDHTLTLTTHSPYILSSINNLIYASQVSNDDNSEAVAAIIPQESHIGYAKVQAFYVDNGKAESIMDSSVRQIKAERIDEISQVLNDEYDQLLALED
ncbi:MAG: hypothetical protein BGN96_12645 [Bacteroidales bacterium 45-6]|nr:MAG: hypothetical protein BGN96_12645 [Bacteroidales bacterium 45-6]